MKYQHEIEIDLPRDKVIELFDNPDDMKHWQKGLVSFEHFEGKEGEPGAKSRLSYKMGKREIEMVETITVRRLPEEFSGTYETKGVWNGQKNYFQEVSPHQTRWVCQSEFRASGLFMKRMMFFMPGAFKKQTYQYMVDFKNFAEKAGTQ
jgi:hypothetical protein